MDYADGATRNAELVRQKITQRCGGPAVLRRCAHFYFKHIAHPADHFVSRCVGNDFERYATSVVHEQTKRLKSACSSTISNRYLSFFSRSTDYILSLMLSLCFTTSCVHRTAVDTRFVFRIR